MSGKKDVPSHNSLGRKLYTKQDDKCWRYNKDKDRWLKHRKTVYLYWYKFLQDCLLEGRKVNKSKYRGWDINTIADTKFDAWWDSHWEKLFSTKERTGTPKVVLTTTQPNRERIRMCWFVNLYDKKYKKGKHNNLEIAYKIVRKESTYRYLTNTNGSWFRTVQGKIITPELLKKWDYDVLDAGINVKEHQRNLKERKRISKAITDIRINANKIIKNVCNGQYP